MYTSIVTIYVGGGGCGISLHFLKIYFIRNQGFSRFTVFPIFTLEFNR